MDECEIDLGLVHLIGLRFEILRENPMQNNILYLLGAGASYYAIPVVTELSRTLLNIQELPQRIELMPGSARSVSIGNLLSSDFMSDCRWLGENAIRYATVDTFAKRLYLLRQEQELNRLKGTLAIFLLLRQVSFGHDSRYDVFFTTIAQRTDGRPMIPETISIATWNYDNQIPISLWQLFFSTPSVHDIPSLFNVYPWVSDLEQPSEKKATLIYANGTAGIIGDTQVSNDFFSVLTSGDSTEEKIARLMEIHKRLKAGNYEAKFLIDFAWEFSNLTASAREQLNRMIKEIDVMVVIGYSCPTFNREFDRGLLKNASKLKRIYIQDISPEPVRDRISSFVDPSIEIKEVRSVDQFYIPAELRL